MDKPKGKVKLIFSAIEISDYIKSTYKQSNAKFWKWFFSECEWGDKNLLDLEDDDCIQSDYMNYYNCIKAEFGSEADENGIIEITNDL